MITIRSSADCSVPTLVALEATLVTSHAIYELSSNGLVIDSASPFSGGLNGAISWPRWRFQIPPGMILEQQMFLAHDGSAAALSWQLHGQIGAQARLTVKPLFAGCGPRGYRDVGFESQTEDEGGRLTGLPNVRGPRIIADTNGSYRDELPSVSNPASPRVNYLVPPGTFEFELSERPSVLIFTNDGYQSKSSHDVGAFLAGLLSAGAPSTYSIESHTNRARLVKAA